MTNPLYIIQYELAHLEADDKIMCSNGIFTEMEAAKQELKNIYKKTQDFKYWGYKIMIFHLVENKYIYSNQFITYRFDEFIENSASLA